MSCCTARLVRSPRAWRRKPQQTVVGLASVRSAGKQSRLHQRNNSWTMAKTETKASPRTAKTTGKSESKAATKAPTKPASKAEGTVKASPEPTAPVRLQEHYKQKVVPAMMKTFSYRNEMQVPHLQAIVVNVGMGKATQNGKLLDSAVEELGIISGQRPVVTRARKAIANFKLRKGLAIGTKLWACARVSAQVSVVPYLLPSAKPSGRRSRSQKVELVKLWP